MPTRAISKDPVTKFLSTCAIYGPASEHHTGDARSDLPAGCAQRNHVSDLRFFIPKALNSFNPPKRGEEVLMKSKVSWKPLGHSAKRWHGMTPRKDRKATLHEARSSKKRGSSEAPVWK
jgi:hypothetical protein